MVFLYAGLGVAMISGIAAMLEIANNVSNFNVISYIKSDKYSSNNLAMNDRRFLEFINDSAAPKSDICKYIFDQTEIERSLLLNSGSTSKEMDSIAPIYNYFLIDKNNQKIPYTTSAIDERLIGSCVLVNNDLNHRVLINKNKSENSLYYYGLFSCYFEDKPYCNFEENKN